MPSTTLLLALPFGFAIGGAVAYLVPRLVRSNSRPWRNLWVAVAAAGAAAAGCTPTGLRWWDMAMTAGAAAAVTALASRARPSWLLAASALGVVVAAGSNVDPLALATVGFAAAIMLTARRAPAAAPVIAAALVQVALRLDLPGPYGVESLAALAVVAPGCYVGYRSLRRSRRKRVRNALLGTAAALTACTAVGAVAAAAARPGLERGVQDASAAVSLARKADQTAASDRFRAAERNFATAERSLGAWWSRPSWLVPIVGPHLRALDAVAVSGEELSAGGVRVARAADLGGLRIRDGVVPLEQVRALEPQLTEAVDTVARARARLAKTREAWLLPAIGGRLDAQFERLDEAEGSLRNTRDVLRILPGLLGAEGPRRYFLAVQTPSELRGSGGFFGNYGEITAVDGKIELARFGRLRELNQGGDPANRTLTGPADYLARYERFDVATTWQNVTFSPDWPSVTQVIAGLYPQSGGQPIDGAIAVDPAGMAALLQLTGPLAVPGWPVPLTAANAEKILLHDQYVQLPNDERIDFLGDAAEDLFERLTTGELPPPSKVLSALGPAVEQKHFQFSSLKEGEQQVFTALGIAGQMAPVRGDALALVAQNASGSKIDWFLQRQLDYRVDIDPVTRKLDATVTATLRNQAPASGLPAVVIGSALKPPLPSGTSRLYVSIYTPWLLEEARIDGRAVTVESESELGRRVYSTFVDVPPGGEVTLELSLVGIYDGGSYRLDVHRQPTVSPDLVSLVSMGRAIYEGEQNTDVQASR